jgi:phosphohistidine phosphatase
MKLYLMRHGPAEESAASGLDADRALTSSGRERVRAVAKALAGNGEEPLHVATSPLVRAVQTAEIVAMVTKLEDRAGTLEVRREAAPGGMCLPFVRSLAAAGTKRAMLVGHEPDLSVLVASLLGTFDLPFEKAMVVALQLDAHAPDDADPTRLRFVLDPKALIFHRSLSGEGPRKDT